jgi:hypothetical protein
MYNLPTPRPSNDGSLVSGKGTDASLAGRVRALEEQIGRLRLVNQALWELIRDRTGLDKFVLEQKIEEIDGRDGRVDGKMTDIGLRCPHCGRVSNSKHGKCLYCGLEFERDTVV